MKATEVKSMKEIYAKNSPFSVKKVEEVKVKEVPVTTPREVIVDIESAPKKAKRTSGKRKPRKSQQEN